MSHLSYLFVPLLAVIGFSPLAWADNYYVDAVNGQPDWPGTQAQPNSKLPSYLTAGMGLGAGDTVFVMPGTYGPTTDYWNGCRVDVSGTANDYFVLKGVKDAQGNRPKLISASVSGLVVADENYVLIEGFEVVPAPTNINGLSNDWWLARSGINVSGNFHNVIVRDCYVHDMPGTGIGSGGANYILIEGNTVEHCGYGSNSGNSGISFYHPSNNSGTDFPGLEGYQIVIKDNVSRYNVNLRGCTCFSNQLTDGNGIILDSFDDVNYAGKSLIVNNVCYGNGGKGISLFKSSHTDIAFNTCYDNSATPDVTQAYPVAISDAEINIARTDHVRLLNNIMANSGNGKGLTLLNSTNFTQAGNLHFNQSGSIEDIPAEDVYGDPGFVAASPMTAEQKNLLATSTNPYDVNSTSASFRDPTNHGFPLQDLQILSTHAAAGAADNSAFQFPVDMLGRSRSGRNDAGAFLSDALTASLQPEDRVATTLYPNPAGQTDEVIITSDYLNGPTTLTICSISGQVLAQQQLQPSGQSAILDLEGLDLSPGLYLLAFQNASQHWSQKLFLH